MVELNGIGTQKAMHVRIVQFDRYELLMIIKTRIDVK